MRGVGPGGDVEGNLHRAAAVGVGPVNDLVGDEVAVGQDHVRAVARADDGRADADAPHLTRGISDLDHVAHFHRPFEQQDDARDEIVDDVLQAKSQAHAERPGDDGDLRQVHAEKSQRDQETDEQHEIVQDRGDRIRQPRRQVHALEYLLVQEKTQYPRHEQRQPDGQRETQ